MKIITSSDRGYTVNYFGAAESNTYSKKYTILGFIFSTIFLPIIIIAIVTITSESVPIIPKHLTDFPGNNILTEIENILPRINEPHTSSTMPLPIFKTEYIAGAPIAANNLDSNIKIPVFASWSNLSSSLSSTTGTTIKFNDIPAFEPSNNRGGNIKHEEQLPDSKDISFVEVEPQIDLETLKRSIVYPQLAIDAGVQGKVIVRVLINSSGKPIKNEVFYSDSKMLETSAVKAVMNSVFTPAIQNDRPVSCWVNIPVSFKLK